MKLTTLRYLVAFADEGSFSRAAERCQVSQPTLSVALQQLESELDVALIERSKGHVALTDLGQQVVAQARRTLEDVRRIELVAQTGRNPLAGDFRLGVIHTIGPYLLPELIAAMRKVMPDMRLFIDESMTALLADSLKYGAIDAAIIALPFDVPGIDVHPLYDEAFHVVVPKGHRWSMRDKIARHEMRGEDVLVLKAGNCFREQVIDACPEMSHADGSALEGHSIETVRCMVASNYGISVLPASSLNGVYCNDMVTAIPFEAPAPSRRVAIAWRNGYTRTEVIDAIITAAGMMESACYLPVDSEPRYQS
ncbi:LysR family transcriptional regulator [Azoarcus sp. L1K30]|uniref:hydrogen peroxide-inducible genes activator n=1 Tax=Azoarcus sp. L1K30 TaxID=2820277 RepID=UPI001B83B89F|nr:hydrogen peroxide-inducible genes activator [Azoarcus sp. L1K30]MBR0567606.1 LysR family transcriptional regulator [Azoarcus sp. L1K30]